MIERLSDLRLFQRIVTLGTLSAAAGDQGVSTGSASLRLAAMERALGVQLFRRTTRQMHLTDAGAEFLETTEAVLAELSNFDEAQSIAARQIIGHIQITAPVDLGRNYIAPSIDRFLSVHPGVSVNLICADSITDIIEQNVDIAVRYGALHDSSLRMRRISSNRRIPVASPSYWATHGMPSHPEELKKNTCMLLSAQGRKNDRWSFVENGMVKSVRVTGDRSTNDGELLRQWALKGYGIALKSAWDVAKDIKDGQLIPVLMDFCPPNVDLQLVFPPQGRQPLRVRRLADHLIKDLKKLDDYLNDAALTPQ